MIRLAAAFCAIATPALSSELQCSALRPITNAYTAHIEVFTGMVDWCMDDRINEPACQTLGRLMKENTLPEKDTAASARLLEFALACPRD